jgi:hypothetical protein
MLLVDPPSWAAHGRRWSHLASDVSVEELHDFAARLGIPERAFEGDHYDVPQERYPDVVAAGAVPVSSRELLHRLLTSGLRRPKRRGERVLGGRPDGSGGRIDAVLSGLSPPGEVRAVHLVLLADGHLLLRPHRAGFCLPGAPVPAATTAQAVLVRLVAALALPAAELARQVGYLRRVPAGLRAGAAYEPVLCWPDQLRVRAPIAGHSWVPRDRAAALLPEELAALAAGSPGPGRGAATGRG